MQRSGARGSAGLCPLSATEQTASTLRAGLTQASEQPSPEGPPTFCLPGCLEPAWSHPYIQGLLELPWPVPSWLPYALPCLGGRNSDLWKRPALLLVSVGLWSSQLEPGNGAHRLQSSARQTRQVHQQSRDVDHLMASA